MDRRNPYHIDRYAADAPADARGVRGAVTHAAGLVTCLVAMAALCLGMLYMLWKVTGR